VRPATAPINTGICSVPYHVSKRRFGELVEQALAGVPEPFATYMEEVSVEVRQRPTPRQLKETGVKRDGLLLGLYVGHPMTQRSVEQDSRLPDIVYIFQEDIELASETEQDLVRQIFTTVLHEIGHHFGLDEDDLDKLGYA
jgi:predicted Zn-dependent protease with MMP-like domain